ncbi:hypothetical protein CN340_08765 [Bacillus anthracis]|nr:hypothetical protein CN340_08765 [Bacillus anthracis]
MSRSFLSYFKGAVRPLPQNSAKAKNSGGGSTAPKSPIGSTNNQWGMKKTPLIKVSLYTLIKKIGEKYAETIL